jgi:serine/threonine protein kinase
VTQIFVLLSAVIALVDAPLDVYFIVSLSSETKLIPEFRAACASLTLAVVLNFACLSHFIGSEMASSPMFRRWFWKYNGSNLPVLFLSLFKFDCLLLICSGIWGIKSLSAPTMSHSRERILFLGIVGNIIEGVPQVVISAAAYSKRQHTSQFLTLATILSSAFSILYALLGRMVARILLQHTSFQPEVSESYFIDRKDLQVGEVLGKGSEGIVRSALYNGAPVAVKVITIGTSISNEATQEVYGEAELLAGLHHPNVVQFFGLALIERPVSQVVIVMGLCQCSLKDHIYNQEIVIDPSRKITLLKDIAHGMHFLHSKGIIHRDLKPGNVLLDGQLTAKVADFGVSCHRPQVEASMTANIGTVAYMAPEVISLHNDTKAGYSNRVDVFSFGITAWACVTRSHPFADIRSVWEIPPKILDGVRPPMHAEFDHFGQLGGVDEFSSRSGDSSDDELSSASDDGLRARWGSSSLGSALPLANAIHDARSSSPTLWALIAQCWSNDPRKRPTFATIKLELDALGGTPAKVFKSRKRAFASEPAIQPVEGSSSRDAGMESTRESQTQSASVPSAGDAMHARALKDARKSRS